MRNEFSREEVINIIEDVLQRPDDVFDAIQNENTDLDAEDFLKMAEASLTALNVLKDVKISAGSITEHDAPIHPISGDATGVCGLNKREYFAAMALIGLAGCPHIQEDGHHEKIRAENAARQSVKMADALIERLNEER